MMESALKSDVRRLCKAASEEEDNARFETLLDELLQVLEERQLMALLF
jgi:hypothetical protein